ncbi:PREDICTED: uncharacterized protein LOC107335136 isoform X1 [Acropora digitifera]|uniref:uncharacterized protein LOC107335136 isoform X1 n=1 Tax=Acropora digitifera TaxID=70779 RepID=UPI00077A65EC|nr:PREDICTED: uncharacterized protein LOC107335136 isoform X1 [Acropora digitifera]
MVYRWKYGACLPHLADHEAVVSSVIEISATTESSASKFNSEVKLVLSHSATDLEGYELVIKVLTDVEKNQWEEIPGCEDIRQVSDICDYPCPSKVPFSFPVVRAGITKCSTYAVVSRLRLSSTYTITVSGGTFAHPDYPEVTVTVPQKAVATETSLSLQLKVQEVPQDEFRGRHLFAGPILHVLCCSWATFLEPVTIQLPVSLGNKLVNIPDPPECRVRIFFLSSEREMKEWIEISDDQKEPASYDGKFVKFKVESFSRYTFLLDWTIGGLNAVTSGIISYLSTIVWNQPLVANFFAYFEPTECLQPRDILFLICCPAHLRENVKQEQEKKGIKPCDVTSRRSMIPGRDKAFVFVSGGASPVPEEKEDCYLSFDGNVPHRAQLEVLVTDVEEFCKVEFRNTREKTENENFLSRLNLRLPSSRIVLQNCSFSKASVPSSEETPKGGKISTSSRKLKVTLLASEWGSAKGGLSTMNRELAIHLAKDDNVEVCMYLPAFSDEDKKAADKCRVRLLKAKEKPGYDPIDWLASVPSDHRMDAVIGHGIHLGRQVPDIKKSHPECKWVQVVHTDPEEYGMFKNYPNPTAKGEKKYDAEVKLCQQADQVVAIGPKLADTYSHSYVKGTVFDLTPGIFSEFADMKPILPDNIGKRTTFRVLVFGRGDSEDFELKGYDIAARAVAKLRDKGSFKLVFVGAPNGKEEKVKKMLLNEGISRRQLIVRSAKEREQLSQQFYEVDLVIMPSRTEGFGLAALEALSAGLPVLVSGNSGFGEVLKEVPFGKNVVVKSEDPEEWAKAILEVWTKHSTLRLKEARDLRKNYSEKYNWEKQCSRLIEKIHKVVRARQEAENIDEKPFLPNNDKED